VGKENGAIPDKNLAQVIVLMFGNSPVGFGDTLQTGTRAGKLSFSSRKKVPDLMKESAVELHHGLCQKAPEQYPKPEHRTLPRLRLWQAVTEDWLEPGREQGLHPSHQMRAGPWTSAPALRTVSVSYSEMVLHKSQKQF